MPASAPGGPSCGSTRRRRRSAAPNFGSRILSRRSSKSRCPPREGPIRPGEAFPVDVDAHYYYGAPGAGLGIEARGGDRPRRRPVPELPGLPDSVWSARNSPADRRDIEAPSTDGDGKAELSVALNDLPDLTRPLAATIRVGVFEPSGRAVSETLTRPIRQRPLAIGLRSPTGDDAVPEGSRSGGRGDRARPAGRTSCGQGSAVRAVARDLGIPLVLGQRHVASQIAYSQPADRCRRPGYRRR